MFQSIVYEFALILVKFNDNINKLGNDYIIYTFTDRDNDGINDLKKNINEIKSRFEDTIEKRIEELDMTMREVYNAPGMPGFEQTNKHYMRHVRRKSL